MACKLFAFSYGVEKRDLVFWVFFFRLFDDYCVFWFFRFYRIGEWVFFRGKISFDDIRRVLGRMRIVSSC